MFCASLPFVMIWETGQDQTHSDQIKIKTLLKLNKTPQQKLQINGIHPEENQVALR